TQASTSSPDRMAYGKPGGPPGMAWQLQCSLEACMTLDLRPRAPVRESVSVKPESIPKFGWCQEFVVCSPGERPPALDAPATVLQRGGAGLSGARPPW